jgi:hypothetical protein
LILTIYINDTNYSIKADSTKNNLEMFLYFAAFVQAFPTEPTSSVAFGCPKRSELQTDLVRNSFDLKNFANNVTFYEIAYKVGFNANRRI